MPQTGLRNHGSRRKCYLVVPVPVKTIRAKAHNRVRTVLFRQL